MIEAPHYSPAGARRAEPFALPADVFDGTVNEPVLHTAVRAYLNNQRQGTHQTKTRSFVSGGNQKPWKQKGTGRARQGSTRAPHWRGGGTVFGPQPRDYTTEIPRKVRQLARRSALNARARETGLHVVERFSFAAPKTRELAALLVTDDSGMRALVRVDPDDHHKEASLPKRGRTRDRSVGIAQSRLKPGSSEATPAGPHGARGPHQGLEPQRQLQGERTRAHPPR